MSEDRSFISPILVGRNEILDAIYRLAGDAGQSKGRLALITGDAGMGKTRLLTSVKESLLSQGWQILEGRCYERDWLLPFAPISDLLRTYLASIPREEPHRAPLDLVSELSKLVPELNAQLTDPVVPFGLDPEQEKRHLFETLTRFFVRLSSSQQLLILIEDIHWSDDTSLEFLLYFAHRMKSLPVFLILTSRHEDIQEPLRHFLAQLDRERFAAEFPLTPLTKTEVNVMMASIFGLSRPVRMDFLGAIYSLTEGNPFYIEEILKSLVMSGDLASGSEDWERKPTLDPRLIPRSVQDTVQRRLERLSDPARQVLAIASVVGQRFDFNLLQDLTQTSEIQLLRLIKDLVAAQFVVEVSADRFAFRHALTREAVYSTLLRRERKQYHHAIATSLERLYPEALEEHIPDLAYHTYQAEEWAKALEFSRRAGERAQRFYAAREAIEYFTRAIQAARQLGLVVPAEVFLARGWAFETAGDFDPAQSDYTCAQESAVQTQDGTADWQSQINLGFLWASRDYGKAGTYFQQALNLSRSLADPRLIAHSLNRVGNWQVNIGRPVEARIQHREALAIFEKLGDSSGMAETFDLLGMANITASDLAEGKICLQKAIAGFQSYHDRQGLASSLTSLMICSPIYQTNSLVASLGLAEAAHTGEQALRIAREIDHRAAEAYALWMIAACLGPAGEYGRAFSLAESGLAIARDIEHTQWMCAAHFVLGALYFDVLAPQEAQEHLGKSLSIANQMGSRFWRGNATAYLALAHAYGGEPGRARELLGEIANPGDPATTSSLRLIQAAWAELMLAEGAPTSAQQIVDGLLASAANLTKETGIPHLYRLRGKALHTLGKAPEAFTSLKAALQSASTSGYRAETWRIQVELAQLYTGAGTELQVLSVQAEAEKVIQELADTLEAPLREKFQEQALAQLPRPVQVELYRKAGPLELTEREMEVARYVALGKSSREIAKQLFLSTRTIETHVGNILSKLGFHSRAQIAAWAVEKGLLNQAGNPPR